MNVEKISGIIDAVDAEAKLPSPSHSNLARLLSLFMRCCIENVAPVQVTTTETINPITPEPAEDHKKQKRKSK